MSTFLAVNDQLLSRRISAASFRVVFVAPAISKVVAEAIGGRVRTEDGVSVIVILAPDEEAYGIGYGDCEGLEKIQQLARDHHMALRSQQGLRLGLLLADDVLVSCRSPLRQSLNRHQPSCN